MRGNLSTSGETFQSSKRAAGRDSFPFPLQIATSGYIAQNYCGHLAAKHVEEASFFFKFNIFIGVKLLYSGVLVSAL